MLEELIVTAYIDSSVMTYIIQAVAGVAIAVGAGFALYFHRIKKKVNTVLKVEEKNKKEVEEDLVVYEKKNKKK